MRPSRTTAGEDVPARTADVGSVDAEPLTRVLAALGNVPADELDHLCNACRDVIGVDGVAVTVLTDGGPPVLLGSSDAIVSSIEDLQGTLGEGPSVDAHRRGTPMGVHDLADPDGSPWVAFAEPALALGAAAVFAFPLRVGGVRVGILSLYQRRTGPLSDDRYACAIVVADVVTQTILARQAEARPGLVADALGGAGDHRAEVHQAAGMLAVRFDTSVGDALVRLRAHAYASGRPLAEVARDVVTRRPMGD